MEKASVHRHSLRADLDSLASLLSDDRPASYHPADVVRLVRLQLGLILRRLDAGIYGDGDDRSYPRPSRN